MPISASRTYIRIIHTLVARYYKQQYDSIVMSCVWCASFCHFDERIIPTSHRTLVVFCTRCVCSNKTTCQTQKVQSAKYELPVCIYEYHTYCGTTRTALFLYALTLSVQKSSVQCSAVRTYNNRVLVRSCCSGCRIVCCTLRTSQFSIFCLRFVKNLKSPNTF